MRTPILLFVALCGVALAQAPAAKPGGAPAPAAAVIDPNHGWYRLTYQRQPVGFAEEKWEEGSHEGKTCWHVTIVGQFVARPEVLRDLPYTDYKVEVNCDVKSLGLQWADYSLSFPVQVAPGATDFKLVQGQVRFSVKRQVENDQAALVFTSTDEEFADSKLPLGAGEEYVLPDAVPRMLQLAGQLRPGTPTRSNVKLVLLAPGLGSGNDAGKYVAPLNVIVKEQATVKIGDEDVKLWPVLVSVPNPLADGTVTDVNLVDDKGVVRKAWTSYLNVGDIKFAEDPQDAVVYTRVATEDEAREGIPYVLTSKGRRNPFVDPRTPVAKTPESVKNISEGGEPTKPPEGTRAPDKEWKPEDAQAHVKEAQALFSDIERVANLGEKATPAQLKDMGTWFQRLTDLIAGWPAGKFAPEKSKVADLKKRAEALVSNVVNPFLTEARTAAVRIEEIFKNEDSPPSKRVQEITTLVERLRALAATPNLPGPAASEIGHLVQEGEKTLNAAKYRLEFESVKPAITGVVVASESVTAPLRIGIVLFRRPVVLEAQIPLPRSRSSVILDVKGSKTGNRSYEEGQAINNDMRVKRIELNKVAFEYKQQTIWVSTATK